MRSLEKHPKSEFRKKIFLALFLLGFVALAFYYSFRIDEDRYDVEIAKAAEKYNIDSRFVKAVIYQESKFDARARGTHGEIGLMQVMPDGAAVDWARYYKRDKLREGLLFNPELNIEIGTWYLARALKRWRKYKHSKELALCQYNAGGKRANAWKPEKYGGAVCDRIKIKSTQAYVKAIMKKYRNYCKNK